MPVEFLQHVVSTFRVFRINPNPESFTGTCFPDFIGFIRKRRTQVTVHSGWQFWLYHHNRHGFAVVVLHAATFLQLDRTNLGTGSSPTHTHGAPILCWLLLPLALLSPWQELSNCQEYNIENVCKMHVLHDF